MLEPIITFILKYKAIFIFYLIIIILLIIKRKQLDVQGKIILLYRTSWGLNFIEKCSQKFKEWIILLGYIGVGAGYVGLLLISYVLVKNLWDLIAVPSAVSGVSLVLPGVSVPGMGVLPFWYWLIAIFIIAIVHEFAHGIVAKANGLNIKNTGIVLLGPIIGAFVEPDEEKLVKQKDITQYSVLAAGPFSNILLAVVALLLLNFVLTPVQQMMVEPTGFTFDAYYNESFSIAQSGLLPGMLITGINQEKTLKFEPFSEKLFCTKPGEKITLHTAEKEYPILLANNPTDTSKSFLGIKEIHNEYKLKAEFDFGIWKFLYEILNWIMGLLRWIFLLSLGIGLFNLLPLPIVDGGRMMQVTMHKVKGQEQGEKWYQKISLFFLLVLILNLVFPVLMKLVF